MKKYLQSTNAGLKSMVIPQTGINFCKKVIASCVMLFALLLLTAGSSSATTYYYTNASNSISATSSWNSNSSGSGGSTPADLVTSTNVYEVAVSCSISSALTINNLTVGDGTTFPSGITFTVSAGGSVSGALSVAGTNNLAWASTTAPVIGTFSATSNTTISATWLTLPAATFGNITVSTGSDVVQGGNLSCRSLTVNTGAMWFSSASSSTNYTLTVAGDFNINGTIHTKIPSGTVTLTLTGTASGSNTLYVSGQSNTTNAGAPTGITSSSSYNTDFNKYNNISVTGPYTVSTNTVLTNSRTSSVPTLAITTATGSITVGNGSNSPVFDPVAYTITVAAASSLVVNSGATLNASAANATPIPAASASAPVVTYAGTVAYTVSSFSTLTQSVVATTYNNLTLSGARTTFSLTLGAAINITGNFVNNATYTSGGLVTASSTVSFIGTGAATQSITGATTFLNVTVGNGTTQNPTLTVNSAITTSGTLTVNSGSTLALGATLTNSSSTTINGNLQLNSSGSIANAPTYSGTSSSLTYATAKTTGVEWNGTGNAITTGVPGNVIINAGDGNAVTLATSVAKQIPATGVLTITSGYINVNSNTFTLNNTATGNIVVTTGVGKGGFIMGSVVLKVTASTTYTVPVGNYSTSTDYYYPLQFVTGASASGTVTVTATKGSATATANSTSLNSISSTEYWTVVNNSGVAIANFSIGRSTAALGNLNVIGYSPDNSGTQFISWGGTVGTLSAINNTSTPSVNTNTSGSLANGSTAYLVLGRGLFTVTYDPNGGTGTQTDASSPYGNGASVTVAALGANGGNIAKTGYTFTGWNTAANGSGTGYVATNTFNISANTTLYAQWSVNHYTLSYDPNGGSGTQTDASSPYAYNTQVTVAAFGANGGTIGRGGFTFSGWNTAPGGGGTAYVAGNQFYITGNTTLYAQWASSSLYSVTYHGNGNTGGAVPTDNGSYATNALVTVLGNTGSLTKTGYSFNNWNTAAGGGGTSYSASATFNISGNTDLYAQYTINQYTVSYNVNTGSGSTPASVTQNYNSGFTTDAGGGLSKTGYTLNRWNTASDGSGTDYALNTASTIPSANITLNAIWVANNYNVTFNSNYSGGAANTTQSIAYNASASLTTNSFTRSGYNFAGWNTVADGSGTPYANGASFTMNVTGITLYAQWTVITYNVIYNTNTGVGSTVTGSQSDPGNYSNGATPTVLNQGTMAKTGWSFNGWNSAANGTGTAYAAGSTVTITGGNFTLYAQWVIANNTFTTLEQVVHFPVDHLPLTVDIL